MSQKIKKINDNIFILKNDDKVIQKYYYNIFLDNNTNPNTLGFFIICKEKFMWLLEKQRSGFNEAYSFVNLNHMNISGKVQNSNLGYKFRFKISFVNYNLENKEEKIVNFLNEFFNDIDLTLLNEENLKIYTDYVRDYIENEKCEYNEIEIQKNRDLNDVISNTNILLSKIGYNLDLYDMDVDDFMNNIIDNVKKINSDFFNNILNYSLYFRCINDNIVKSLLSNIKINTIEKVEYNLGIKHCNNFEYNFKDFVSISTFIVSYSHSNKILDKLYSSLLNHIIWVFYFDIIREKHQLIYSPNIRYLSINPSIICISNKTNNNNLEKLIEYETDFFKNISKYITLEELNNFKNRLEIDLINSIEESDVEFFGSLISYLDIENCDSLLTIQQLSEFYLENVRKLNLKSAKNNLKKLDIILTSQTKGNYEEV